MDAVGDARGRGEISSLDPAEGRTSLIRSSEARRSSFRSRSLPMADEEVSVLSEARMSTGVGKADLAVLGLKSSYWKDQQELTANLSSW